jgi:hypothetical protein
MDNFFQYIFVVKIYVVINIYTTIIHKLNGQKIDYISLTIKVQKTSLFETGGY